MPILQTLLTTPPTTIPTDRTYLQNPITPLFPNINAISVQHETTAVPRTAVPRAPRFSNSDLSKAIRNDLKSTQQKSTLKAYKNIDGHKGKLFREMCKHDNLSPFVDTENLTLFLLYHGTRSKQDNKKAVKFNADHYNEMKRLIRNNLNENSEDILTANPNCVGK